MVAFWVAIFVIYAGVAVYCAPAAWSALFSKRPRRGDPMRLACFLVSIVIAGFNLRWLIAPDAVQVWKALYVLCGFTGIYILILARTYGRGPRV